MRKSRLFKPCFRAEQKRIVVVLKELLITNSNAPKKGKTKEREMFERMYIEVHTKLNKLKGLTMTYQMTNVIFSVQS